MQLDFDRPVRFDLSYATEKAGKLDRPVLMHRAVLGSFEKMFAILTEHYRGKWPLWLSPRQAIVLPVSPCALDYAEMVRDRIHAAGFFVDVDTSDRVIHKKVRQAELAQYNYVLVVGAKQADTGEVRYKGRDDAKLQSISLDDLLGMLHSQVEAFK
ncbi:hypothetical protein LUZ60_000079 [Juncus effusus]|nr:hypothetical protein LUZ60_000079 [Juncus effusus]